MDVRSSIHLYRSCRRLWHDHLPRVELDQHGRVGLKVFDGHSKSEVIQEQELKLQMIQFCERQAANLTQVS